VKLFAKLHWFYLIIINVGACLIATRFSRVVATMSASKDAGGCCTSVTL
jgi:hypothetical protein